MLPFIGLVLLTAPVRALTTFENDCEARLPPTKIEVTVDEPRVVYDFSQSSAALTRKKPFGGRGVTLGLTVFKEEFGIETGHSMFTDSKGQVCIRPQFKVAIKLNPQRVYIGREFAKDTCAFNEIMVHEQRHVQANQSHALAVAHALAQNMRASFANDVYYGEADKLPAELIRVIRVGWLPHIKSELAKVEELHKNIDTVQEYARNNTLCNGEVLLVLSRNGLDR